MSAVFEEESAQPGITGACDNCALQDRCPLALTLPPEVSTCAGVIHRCRPVARAEHLYRRGSPFASLFIVCAGTFKTQRETPDGELVVTGFYLPGDVVGVDAIAGSHHPTEAVATSPGQVCRLNFRRLMTACSGRPGLQAWVMAQIGAYVRRHDADLSWSTGLGGNRRVLRFFVELYERLTPQSDSAAPRLPMRKQDIARYLRMTPETLSRNLSQLCRDGLLELHQDQFQLPDAARARRVTRL